MVGGRMARLLDERWGREIAKERERRMARISPVLRPACLICEAVRLPGPRSQDIRHLNLRTEHRHRLNPWVYDGPLVGKNRNSRQAEARCGLFDIRLSCQSRLHPGQWRKDCAPTSRARDAAGAWSAMRRLLRRTPLQPLLPLHFWGSETDHRVCRRPPPPPPPPPRRRILRTWGRLETWVIIMKSRGSCNDL